MQHTTPITNRICIIDDHSNSMSLKVINCEIKIQFMVQKKSMEKNL